MKKLTGLIVVLVLSAGAFAATVTVTKPAAGDTWIKGQPYQVNWTKSGDMPNTVRISLRDKTGVTEVKLIADNQANSGVYPWTIPADVADGQYIVRVKVKNAAVSDDSDIFNIAASAPPPPPAATIAVSAPAAGAKWHRGDPEVINWTKSGTMPNAVKISLMNAAATMVVKEIVDGAPNSGSFSWTVPNDVPFGDYKVRVLVKTTTVTDDSDAFSVVDKSTVPPGNTPQQVERHAGLQSPPGMTSLIEVVTKPAVYSNWSSYHHTPVGMPVGMPQQIAAGRTTGFPSGEKVNSSAHVGYDYFYVSGVPNWGPGWLTMCFRSKVLFYVSEFVPKLSKLISAKMHFKQIGRYAVADDHASCGTGLFILLGPWTDFLNPPIKAQGSGGLDFGSTEYDIDITDTVKNWLSGALANNGMFLVSQEVDWGQTTKTCISRYEVSLVLKFKKD